MSTEQLRERWKRLTINGDLVELKKVNPSNAPDVDCLKQAILSGNAELIEYWMFTCSTPTKNIDLGSILSEASPKSVSENKAVPVLLYPSSQGIPGRTFLKFRMIPAQLKADRRFPESHCFVHNNLPVHNRPSYVYFRDLPYVRRHGATELRIQLAPMEEGETKRVPLVNFDATGGATSIIINPITGEIDSITVNSSKSGAFGRDVAMLVIKNTSRITVESLLKVSSDLAVLPYPPD